MTLQRIWYLPIASIYHPVGYCPHWRHSLRTDSGPLGQCYLCCGTTLVNRSTMSQLYGKVDKVLAAIDKSDSNGFLRGEDFMKII